MQGLDQLCMMHDHVCHAIPTIENAPLGLWAPVAVFYRAYAGSRGKKPSQPGA